ncbi:unnamed protein product [Calypogeia fissa]
MVQVWVWWLARKAHSQAQEIENLQAQLKDKPDTSGLEQCLKEKAKWEDAKKVLENDLLLEKQKEEEIGKLKLDITQLKTQMEGLEKEAGIIAEERDEVLQDASNAASKEEQLEERIKELEGQLSAKKSNNTPNKRPQSD